MSNIIDKIQVSGITYQIQGSGGGGVPESTFTAYTATTDERISQDEEVTAAGLNALNNKITPTVELTQAQYDALVDKDPNTYYIITDAQAGDLTNYYTKSETNTLLGGKQATLVSGTNIKTINNESILGSGNIDIQGGSTYTAGRGISIANDTISFSLPISAGTGTNSVIEGYTSNKATGSQSHAEGYSTTASGSSSHAEGYYTKANGNDSHAEGFGATANGKYSHAEGGATNASGQASHAEGDTTIAKGINSHTEGWYTIANNQSEHASGQYNVSSKANTAWGYSGNTLFSVGNGTGDNARHNAFEIRQNGDIYLSSGGTDIKLQDHLGGGGSVTVDTALDSGSTNPVENRVIYNKIDEVEQVTARALNELDETVSGKVDTSTYNTYTAATDTALNGKQATLVSGTNIKTINNTSILGSGNIDIQGGGTIDTSLNSGSTNAVANSAITNAINTKQDISKLPTYIISNVSFNNNKVSVGKVNKATGGGSTNTNNVITINNQAIFNNSNLSNLSLVETSAITTSITSSSTDAQVPSAKAVYDNFGGLKLVKLTEAEYNALATKDSSTLYIIVN